MTSHFEPLHHPDLTAQIRRVLKEGRITETSLPLTPEIRLYLLNGDYPRHALTREETEALMEDPPFWSFCWSSGQVLARWISKHKELVAGRRVLDFGTGSGIVAIAAARAGARSVVACDIDLVSLQAVRANGALNQVEIDVCMGLEEACADGLDVILAADVLYDRELFPVVEKFPQRVEEVVLADSRVRDLQLDPYHKIGCGEAVTCPDLQEPEEHRLVSIYGARRG